MGEYEDMKYEAMREEWQHRDDEIFNSPETCSCCGEHYDFCICHG